MAEQYGVELLAELPLHIAIREQADGGRPSVAANPEDAVGRAYIELARRTSARLARAALTPPAAFPDIVVEET
jgi:ATP-binding protein involved in chromosome partitioning